MLMERGSNISHYVANSLWKMLRRSRRSGRAVSLSPPVELSLCLFKHNATDIYGAVEIQFQEFLSWAVDPDGQLYNPVALCTEE